MLSAMSWTMVLKGNFRFFIVALCILIFTQCRAQHRVHTPYWDMLPHHRITNYDVTLLKVLISI